MWTSDSKFFFTGLLTIVLGCLLSWISSLFTYGFGVIISNVEKIKKNTEVTSASTLDMVNIITEKKIDKTIKTKEDDLEKKEKERVKFSCPSCKTELSRTLLAY